MEEKLIRLYNQTGTPLTIFIDGQQLVMEGFDEKSFSPDVAAAFKRHHPGKIVNATKFEQTVTSDFKRPKTAYVANMTGDPDAPEKIKVKVWEDRKNQYKMVPNPAAKPIMLREWAQGAWKERKDKYGALTTDRKPGRYVTVPPFQRVEMELGVANWFVNRQNLSTPYNLEGPPVRKALLAREPLDFEPSGEWSLDELRAYLKFMDPQAKLGQDEATIRKNAIKARLKPHEVEHRVEEAKRVVFKRAFLRMVDPQWPNKPPTRREFEEFYHGLTRPAEQPDESPLEEEAIGIIQDALDEAAAAGDAAMEAVKE